MVCLCRFFMRINGMLYFKMIQVMWVFFLIWLQFIHGIYTWYFMIRLGQGSSLHQRHLPSSSKPNKQRCKSLQIKTRPLNTHRTVNLPTNSRFIFIYLFQCLNFVSTEYTVIAEKIIKKLLDPTQVCEMVKVCPEK